MRHEDLLKHNKLMKELLHYNEVEPKYGSFGQKSDDPLDFDNIMKRQEEILEELKVLAKKNCTLLGREIRFPMADSFALYVITKVNQRTVQITWVKWCDAWQDDRAGYQSNLDINYATQQVYGRDRMEELFSQKKAQQ